MSENEIGIEQARATIGDLASRAHYAGEVTYITRRGRRVAAIAPIDRIKEPAMAATAQDLAHQVSLTLGDHIEDFDINAIVEEIREKCGAVGSIDDVPSEEYNALIERHDKTAGVFTLISAVTGDSMPEGAVEISDPDCPLDWHDLPEDAANWAVEQGYGLGQPDELLYVVRGDVELEGWPTYRIER